MRCPTIKGHLQSAASGVRWAALTAALVVSAGCVVGPDYVRPAAPVPTAYRELEEWKAAQPRDESPLAAWWTTYGDAQLDALEEQVDISNQNLAAAEAQYRQARALVQSARAAYFPTLTAGVAVARARQSANIGGNPSVQSGTFTDYSMPLDVSWEADVWGRVRRSVESSTASAQASAADLQATRLSAQAELAGDYFLLRTLDAQRQLLEATAAAYEKSLELTENRYAGGVAARADVVQAQAQLETTQAQAIDVGVQRAQLEHAIAVLIGEPPADLSIPPLPLTTPPPPIPVGLPSALLERRPDIAAAERRMAAANAQIGVAEAAYYPAVTLSASGGFNGSQISKWLVWPSRFWSVGPAISETVYDGGLRQAQSAQARAAYDATVALYRQSVLTAFQDVEDNLAALRILEHEAQVEDGAVNAAQESVTLTTNKYKAGTVSYLDVVVTQTTALSNQRTAVDILGRRLTASVLLIKALGGGWTAADLPPADSLAAN